MAYINNLSDQQKIVVELLLEQLQKEVEKDLPDFVNCEISNHWYREPDWDKSNDSNYIPFHIIIEINNKYLHLEYYIDISNLTTLSPFKMQRDSENLYTTREIVCDVMINIIEPETVSWFFK